MKRAAFYVRVSTVEQHPETQLRELREYVQRRGLTVAQEQEFVDHGIGGTKARRPRDRMLEDARRRRFDVLLVGRVTALHARRGTSFRFSTNSIRATSSWCLARGVRVRRALGRAFLGIVAVLGEMERALLIERVRSGMARARAEGRQIGRARLDVNREQVFEDHRSGTSLTQVARKHNISGFGMQADERGNLQPGCCSSRARWEHAGASGTPRARSMNKCQIEAVGKVFVVVRGMRRCLICGPPACSLQASRRPC